MNSPEANFFKKIGKKVAKTATGVAAAAMFAHLVSEKMPQELNERDISPAETELVYKKFDSVTLRELYDNEAAYIADYVSLSPEYSNVDTAVLSERFRELIAKYGQGLRISFTNAPDAEKGKFDKFQEAVFTNLGGNTQHRPHYVNSTIYYPDGGVSSNLVGFISEFSHHVNGDSKARRVIRYGEDLIDAGLHQRGLYDDNESIEYQAHSVTEKALRAYLYAPPEQFGVSFESIKNHLQDAYEHILEDRSLSEQEMETAYYQYCRGLAKHLDDMDSYRKDFFAAIPEVLAFAQEQTGEAEKDRRYFVFANRFAEVWEPKIQ